jgi:hypothetical protein
MRARARAPGYRVKPFDGGQEARVRTTVQIVRVREARPVGERKMSEYVSDLMLTQTTIKKHG